MQKVVVTGYIVFILLCVLMLAGIAHARPWCGLYARSHLVSQDPGPAYNLACRWLQYGRPTYAHQGAMVIWCNGRHHHVGKITGPCQTDANGNQACVVTSGNDGGRVRTRLRSVAGAVFREG